MHRTTDPPPSTLTSSSVRIIAVARACYYKSWRLDEGKQTRRRSLAKRGLVGDERSEARRGGPLLPAALGSPPCPRRMVLQLAAIT